MIMGRKSRNFLPIKLVKTNNNIRQRGDFVCEIIGANYQDPVDGRYKLSVCFRQATEGDAKGFKLRERFFDNFESRRRLSYLCRALGIFGELEGLDQLVGRSVLLRIIPPKHKNKDSGKSSRKFINYKIKHFYSVDCGLGEHGKSQALVENQCLHSDEKVF